MEILENIRIDIGLRIKAKREKIGLSQEDLAVLSGLSVNTISLIENGDVWAKLDSIVKIVNTLKMKMVELFEGY